ncbi:MAG: DUF389 domain-containing protein [Cyanobacteria bacterium]|nr:DUF389 domain-containing protein [Cyanobacteriota bacterium]MDA0865411.1 DUF389 domain-containing protein [Cyanobacteriota bacterium]
MKQELQELRHKYFSNGRRVSPQALKYMCDSLQGESTLDLNFTVLIIGSCIIATFGLISNSTAVIIGAMLIAPLMLPIRGIAFGILEAEGELIREGFKALGIGTAIAILLSTGLGISTGIVAPYGSEILARSQPTLLDLGIAIAAGALAGFAKIEAKLSSSLAGTAIAVALMPPLCVVGLWLAKGNWQGAGGAILLYATNLLGITLACMVAFWLAGYSPLNRARRPIQMTLILTSLLVIPLGFSTFELWRQTRLESSVRRALLGSTDTFQRLQLVDLQTDWLGDVPEVTLVVYAREPVTPKQVRLLEDFLAEEMGQPFQLNFEVSDLEDVGNMSDLQSVVVPFIQHHPSIPVMRRVRKLAWLDHKRAWDIQQALAFRSKQRQMQAFKRKAERIKDLGQL